MSRIERIWVWRREKYKKCLRQQMIVVSGDFPWGRIQERRNTFWRENKDIYLGILSEISV